MLYVYRSNKTDRDEYLMPITCE